MERPLSSLMLAEAYGTFLLTFIGATSITVASDASIFPAGTGLGLGFIGLAHGVALLAGVAALGSVSGAFFNPAITIGAFASGRLPRAKVAPYIVAQFAGAILAAVVELGLVGMTAASVPGVDLGSNLPNTSLPIPYFSAVLAEIVGTMILTFTVLASTDPDSSGISWASSSIGLVLAACIWALGGISGAALNPARAFGPAVISLLFDTTPMADYWIYLVGPILGGLLAAQLYRTIFRPHG
ncbi:MAG TPA: aquaporin [Nitrososphaerales archaeon]|nr:aquaporin [Nitrososphaerales archaeon]HUK74703.1 aquaporin [Nitrososphaerales archaeon]